MYLRKQRDKWRVEIQRNGVRLSAVFETKSAAQQWGIREESALIAEKRGAFPRRTLSEAIDRYVEKVSALKAGHRFEKLRLDALRKNFPELAGKVLSRITTADLVSRRACNS